MSSPIDLWETAPSEGRERFDNDYYITNYSIINHHLYIKPKFYKHATNDAAIIKALHKAKKMARDTGEEFSIYFFTKVSPRSGKRIEKEADIETYRKLLSPSPKVNPKVVVFNPGEYDEETMEPVRLPTQIGHRATGGAPDLWELAENNDFNHPEYYKDRFHQRTLFIKKAYYSIPANKHAIIQAFHSAEQKNRDIQRTTHHYHLRMEKLDDSGMYEQINTREDLGRYIQLTPKKKGVYISNPGEYSPTSGDIHTYPTQVGIRNATPSPEGGAIAATFKKSTLKKRVAGRERVIYLGAHNKHYVKIKGAFVAVRDAA